MLTRRQSTNSSFPIAILTYNPASKRRISNKNEFCYLRLFDKQTFLTQRTQKTELNFTVLCNRLPVSDCS